MNNGEFIHWLRAPLQYMKYVSCSRNRKVCACMSRPCIVVATGVQQPARHTLYRQNKTFHAAFCQGSRIPLFDTGM